MIDCVGTGPACTSSRCDSNVLHQCMKGGFGQGNERLVDCSEFGLVCHESGQPKTAACMPVVVSAANSCGDQDVPTCDGANLKLCILGQWTSQTCAEFGLSGSCQPADAPAYVTCK